MKAHLNEENLFLALNTWAISVIKYSAAFLDWSKKETKELDRWIWKQLTVGRALHPKSNVISIYVKRRCRGWGLISVEECSTVELRSIDFYLVNSEQGLLKVVIGLDKLWKDKNESKNDYNSKIDESRSMKLHGKFGRDEDNKKSERLWH